MVKGSAPLSSALQASSRWSENGRSRRPKERLAHGEGVAVEDRLGRAAFPRLPADQRVLAALAMAAEIGVGPVGGGYGRIVFLDAALHLREQDVLQRGGSGEGRLRIGVLGLEIGADLGIEQARIAHHRLPAGILEPGELVGQGDAMAHRARGTRGGVGGAGNGAATLDNAVKLMDIS